MTHGKTYTPSPRLQVALSAMTAILALNCVAAANTIAQTRIAPPLEVFPAIFAGVGLTAFFMPLLWWRHKAGFAGAMVVAALSITWPLLVLSGVAGELSAAVPLSPVGILTYMAMPVVLAVSAVSAWREHTGTTTRSLDGFAAAQT